MRATTKDCRLIPLPRVTDARGSLTFLEVGTHVPFHFQRMFNMYGLPRDTVRGGHAHKQCAQFLIALDGTFEVTLDDGSNTETLLLSRPDHGLHIPPGIWVTLRSRTPNALITALASEPYEEADYLRDHAAFLQWRTLPAASLVHEAADFLVRPYVESDAALFSRTAREAAPSVGRWLDWCHEAYDEAKALGYIRACTADATNRRALSFGIFLKSQPPAQAGGIAINRIDWSTRTGNLGYWIAPHAAGRGIATRAALWACRHAFEHLGLQRIEILTEVTNAASQAVARRLGARHEARLRSRIRRGDQALDAELFSLIPSDLSPVSPAPNP